MQGSFFAFFRVQGRIAVSLGVIFLPASFLLGIFFTASAMDEKSAVFLDSLDVPFIKIGSGDVNNLRLLKLGKRRTTFMITQTILKS